ncbi:Transposon Tf2-9 polyprotein [Linum perenne]
MHGEEHENTSEEEPEPGEEEVTVEPEATSFLAMGGNPQGSAIKLKGRLGRMALIILIDTGSSHTFLSDKSAQTLNCTLLTAPPMRRQKFTFDVRIIPLKENDLVLGFDWLRTVSPVSMDFENLQMTFQWDGKPLTLIGMEETSSCQWLSGKEFGKYVTKGHFWGLAGHLCEAVMEQQPASVPAFLKEILVQFRDVFLTPTTLPHSRPCDHAIPLTEGAKPVNLRPYRYPPAQKDEIERLVEEMMAAGVIQTSHSPFASPVLLVKKKDGTWRFCVDYRQLNSVTIKDKFPIPMIDDLLDELAGSCFFTKLDLRAGYHQIRMRPEDQHKTAFRTHHGHFEFRVMPFGLTNAPATFQALMNQVLAPYLRKFVLVFFDDILIYSSTEEAHKDHLYKTLQLLREHKLLAKKSKCSFGQQKIEYLGHIVTSEGVATDSKKIAAMIQWPYPKTIKALRGFLGLTGYYRKFIRNYAIISKPLTELLKKNQFQWSETAAIAFDELKQAMTTAPVLALPDFTKAFTLETDASGIGIGAVLSQQGRPIAYLSQVLSLRNQSLSTYEKEYLAVIFAVGRWRHYLEGHPFTILTDHESLKYLLGQKIHTHIQKKGLIKLLGLDFEIRYRQGKFNRVADALSRVFEDPLQPSQCSNITAVLPEWLTEVERSYDNDDEVQALIIAAAVAPGGPSMYCYSQGLLKYKGMVYVGGSGEMRKQLMNLFHSSPTGGHSGGQATYQRMKKFFYWPGMKRDITQWVAACQTCQQCKAETTPYPGLLQPLPIPDRAWQHISMDFIEGLPKSDGKEVIWVVVDRLTKYSHFIAVSHPYTAVTIAQLFMDHIFKLHGMPTTIVSDRDVIFTSNFWKEMFRLQGTNLHYSTAYHPQTDGQTERLNRCLEDYLRCMVMGKAQAWHQWLALAEWWYNTNYHNSLKITPFEALYGYPPSMFSLQNPLSTSVAAVADRMRQQHQLVDMMRQNLAKAQNRQKQYADKHRSERAFAVGDWVYLRLHPYKQSTIAARVNQKLAPRFYGPFLILEKKGAVAYKLKLPDTAAIHPVFHVSLLKKMVGVGGVVQATLPDVDATGVLKLEPVAILARQFIKRNNIAVTQVLVQWSHQTEADAVWEDWETFKQAYPDFQQS